MGISELENDCLYSLMGVGFGPVCVHQAGSAEEALRVDFPDELLQAAAEKDGS